jgi:hypothetical protein
VDLSSFRTYLARLSAGYSRFRSGENDSSLGNRPLFPYGAGFPPGASDKQAPGSPPTGRRSFGPRADCAKRDSNHDPLAEEEGFDPSVPDQGQLFETARSTFQPLALRERAASLRGGTEGPNPASSATESVAACRMTTGGAVSPLQDREDRRGRLPADDGGGRVLAGRARRHRSGKHAPGDG